MQGDGNDSKQQAKTTTNLHTSVVAPPQTLSTDSAVRKCSHILKSRVAQGGGAAQRSKACAILRKRQQGAVHRQYPTHAQRVVRHTRDTKHSDTVNAVL